MKNFSIYRLPRQRQCTLLLQEKGKPSLVKDISELQGQSGFVIAPFQTSDEEPAVVIHPDGAVRLLPEQLLDTTEELDLKFTFKKYSIAQQADTYSRAFDEFIQLLHDGELEKVVLTRQLTVPFEDGAIADSDEEKADRILSLYIKACEKYPRMFVALVSTETTGTWLTATPEILLEGDNGNYSTVALAGTMSYEENSASDIADSNWSEKDRKEQKIVTDYIAKELKAFSQNITIHDPITVRAGNLIHLRSDFEFSLNEDNIGKLLSTIHPTPAVCGMPKRKALETILSKEGEERHYYCGFIGTINCSGTHLFVNLRCMNIESDAFHLYAGGGLLKESTLEKEWNETEIKMNTMKDLLSS